MINGDVNEFVDHIKYGDELIFKYEGKTYFLEGLFENEIFTLYLDRWNPPADDYIWLASSKERYPADEFLKAKIWDGKSFWEVENQIEWID